MEPEYLKVHAPSEAFWIEVDGFNEARTTATGTVNNNTISHLHPYRLGDRVKAARAADGAWDVVETIRAKYPRES